MSPAAAALTASAIVANSCPGAELSVGIVRTVSAHLDRDKC